MKCTDCGNVAPDDAFYCGSCGSELRAGCKRCGRPVPPDSKFCVGCGAHLVPAAQDDSFLEGMFKRSLRFISRRCLGFTHMVMRSLVLMDVAADAWAVEEIAYLLGLCVTYGALMFAPVGAGHELLSCALIVYVAYRLLDIISYELQIVFVDRHQDVAIRNGHLLSVDRRVLCLFIHVLDFIGCYAILFLAVTTLECRAFSAPGLASPVEALYFSVIVASFTGLSSVTPVSDCARLAVISEIVLNLVLFSIVFATVVSSLGGLTELKPRPGRSSGIFHRKKPRPGA